MSVYILELRIETGDFNAFYSVRNYHFLRNTYVCIKHGKQPNIRFIMI